MNKSAQSIQPRFRRQPLALAVAVVLGSLPPAALAAPEGGQIVGGSGSISQSGALTTIDQQSARLAIDWQRFDVGADETVRFQQPSAQAVALNRILDQKPSEIFGKLEANGQVVLVNARGILFSESATVQVGGLVASGLDIDSQAFMNGEWLLRAQPGSGGFVINKGLIEAASGATLVGRSVSNEGTKALIAADVVNLAAGDAAVITFDNDGLVGVKVTEQVLENRLGVDAAVRNSGTLQGRQVLMTAAVAGDLFSAAVNNSGVVKAAGINTDGGVIRLVGSGGDTVNSGVLDASSVQGDGGRVVVEGDTAWVGGSVRADSEQGRGGSIDLLGDRVAVHDAARVSADGASGGGTIQVGGSWQGADPGVRRSSATYVSADSTLSASATDRGDGGEVAVWSDGLTRFFGRVDARGGANGGDGGRVETSGLQQLIAMGRVDTGAASGNGGTWLLDPADILISAAASTDIDDSASPFAPATGVSASVLNATVLADYLENTGNLIITTTNTGAAGSGTGTITFADGITWTSVNNLTLNADGSIVLNNGVGIDGAAGSLNFNAGNGITLNSGSSIDVGGNATFNAVNFSNAGSVTAGAIVIAVGAGGVGSSNQLGSLSATGGIAITGGSGADSFSLTGVLSGATIDGGGGGDSVIAGSGDNSFILTGSGTFTDQNSNAFSNIASVDAGAGSNDITGSAGVDAFTLGGANQVSAQDITFSGIAAVAGGGGADTVTAAAGGSLFDLISSTSAEVGGILFSAIDSFAGGAGDDTFSVRAGYTGGGSIDAGGGNNTLLGRTDADGFTLTDTANQVEYTGITFSNINAVDGNGGSGTLTAAAGGSIFDLISSTSAQVSGMLFTAITGGFAGGAGDDTFSVRAGYTGGGSIDAGTGNNTLLGRSDDDAFALTGTANQLTYTGITFSNISAVDGNGGADTLTAAVGGSIFDLISATSADVDSILFTAIAGGFAGGAGNDTFSVRAGYTGGGSIDAGGGNNTLLGRTDADGFTLTDTANQVEYTGITFSNINAVDGNGGTGALTAAAGGSIFDLISATSAQVGGMLFTAITGGFAGGAGDDTFSVRAGYTGGGNIDAGAGNNTLLGRAGADAFALTGTANQLTYTGITFSNITAVDGNGGADTLTAAVSGSIFDLISSTSAQVDSILFTAIAGGFAGGAGDDTFSVRAGYTGGGSIDAGTGNNTLLGRTDADSFALTGTANQVEYTGITFSNINAVDGNGGTDTLTAATGGSIFDLISATSADVDSILFTAIAGGFAGGAGNDTFSVRAGYTGGGSIDAGAGNNTLLGRTGADGFVLTGTTNQVEYTGITFSNIGAVDGNGGADTLTAAVGGSVFDLISSTSAQVDNILFTTIAGGFAGGAGDDTFSVRAGYTGGGSIDAGAGNNTLLGRTGADAFTLTGTANELSYTGISFSNISAVDGNGGTDTLTAAAGGSIFDLISATSAQVDSILFTAIAGGFAGGAGDDTFSVRAGYTGGGSINAGAGNNTLLGRSGDDVFALTGTANQLTYTGITFSNIGTVDGNGGADGLTGSSGADAFTLAGTNALGVAGIAFSGIATVAGGGGADTVTAAAAGSLFDLISATSAEVSGIVFTAIGSFAGGAGDDTFSVRAGYSGGGSIDAGAGNNTLLGRSGDDGFALTGTANQVQYTGITFSNIGGVDGNGGTDTLTAAVGGSVFDLISATSAQVDNILFTAISGGFAGGAGDDTFSVRAGYTGGGSIDAGGGNNSLLGRSGADGFVLTGTANQVEYTGITFSNIGAVDGNGGADTLTAAVGGSIFDLISSTSAQVDNILFTTIAGGFAGGAGDDTFSVRAGYTGGGSIDAGAGNNTLLGRVGNDAFALTGTANQVQYTGITFSNIGAVDGNGGADTLAAAASGSIFDLISATSAQVDSILFTAIAGGFAGGAGDDTFSVRAGYSGGGSINAGAGNNTLLGRSGDDAFALTGTANQVSYSGIIFSNLNNVDGNGGSDTLAGSAGADAWQLLSGNRVQAAGVAFAGIGTVNGNGGADTVVAAAGGSLFDLISALSAEVDGILFSGIAGGFAGGAGDDTFSVRAGYSGGGNINAGAGNNTLLGRSGDDAFALTGTTNQVQYTGITFSNIGAVDGNGGADTLTAAVSGSIFDLISATSAQVDNILFTAIAGGFAGGAGDDTFSVRAGYTGGGSINAGAGNNTLLGRTGADTFTLTGSANQVQYTGITFSNIGAVAGNGGADTLTAAAGGSIFDLISATSAQVDSILFTAIAGGFAGGAGNDVFSVRAGYSGGGSIDAGGGDDTLLGNAGADHFAMTGVLNEVAYSGITFSNLERVDGNGGADTLTAALSGSIFDLISATSAQVDNILFTGIAGGFAGGAGNDTFSLRAGYSGGGSIDAGGGINTLLGSAGDDLFTLNGTDNQLGYRGVSFINIHEIDAGAGTDVLQGAAGGSQFSVEGGGRVGAAAMSFRQLERVVGGAGFNTVLGQSGGSVFAITGADQGSVDGILFSAVQRLQGGAGADSFAAAAGAGISGGIDGGGGIDSLSAQGGSNQWVVASSGNQLNGFAFSGIEHLLDQGTTAFALNTNYAVTLAAANTIEFAAGEVVDLRYANVGRFDVSAADLLVAALDLPGAVVSLRSAAAVRGVGGGTQVRAGWLGIDAVGAIDLNTEVATLEAQTAGDIDIRQDGNLLLERVRGANISVESNGDLTVTEVSTGNAGLGSVRLVSTLGNLLVSPQGNGRVNVTAGSIRLDALLEVGSVERPFYLHSATAPRIDSLQYVNPLLVSGTPAPVATGKRVASLTEVIASSGLRSAVQTYAEDIVSIDPAIFTALLPFSVDEEALALPEDQRPD